MLAAMLTRLVFLLWLALPAGLLAHEVWARAQGTQVRERASGFRYTPTTCFETFPFPAPTDAHREAIAVVAQELNALRERWLNPPESTREEVLEFPASVDGPWARHVEKQSAVSGQLSVPETAAESAVLPVRYPRLVAQDDECAAKLKKRTLTNLDNERPTWLANAHEKLDAAVFPAYGWPADLSDEQILARLLMLNVDRRTSEIGNVRLEM